MNTALLCVGKLREAHWRAAAAEYAKRLSRFGGVETLECPDLPGPKNASEKDLNKVVEAEGAALLARLRPRDYVIALCVSGERLSSTEWARRLAGIEAGGAARAVFVIGGSWGLSEAVLRRADMRLSFSDMTFPHQLVRVMLLEQLYRARKILANETYHK